MHSRFKPTNDSWGDKKVIYNIKGIFGVSENGQGQETKKGPGQKEDMGEFTESWPNPFDLGKEQLPSSTENRESGSKQSGYHFEYTIDETGKKQEYISPDSKDTARMTKWWKGWVTVDTVYPHIEKIE